MAGFLRRNTALLRQMASFAVVGALNTLLTQGLYNVLLFVQAEAPLAWALGYVAGTVFSFLINKRWTFRQKSAVRPVQAARFVLVNLLSLLASTGAVALLTGPLQVNESLAGLLTLPLSLAINFIGSRRFVFDRQ